MTGPSGESRLPRLRLITPSSSLLLVAAAAAWVAVVEVAGDMGTMPGTMGLGFASFVAVWTLMMTAMMLPAVAPFAALYATTLRQPRALRLVAFAAGYLLVWSATALPAYALAALADPLVTDHHRAAVALAVVICVACGIYQFTPLKERCLAHCRSPLGFALRYGAYQGRTRDVRIGAHHGAFCVGCCWALTGLLLVFGLMNVAAMVVLATIVVVEKVWARGPAFSRVLGGAALVLAVLVLFAPGIATGLGHVVHTGGRV